jgi:hypothetical protein
MDETKIAVDQETPLPLERTRRSDEPAQHEHASDADFLMRNDPQMLIQNVAIPNFRSP